MAESTCILHSFSHASDTSLESKEANPMRAVGESISFGRFMSESLSWEKWSSFNHNRYMEEVKKYSKPGSVAQKKAYFEAHYKRAAAQKAEAALIEQENSMPSSASHSGLTDDIHCKFSDDLQSNVVKNIKASDSKVERVELENAKVEGEEIVVKESVNMENPVEAEFLVQLEKEDNHEKTTTATPERELLIKEDKDQEVLASITKRKLVMSSMKSSNNSKTSKLLHSPAKMTTPPIHTQKERNSTSSRRMSRRDSVGKMKAIPNLIHVSVDFPTCSGKTSKTVPILPRTENPRFPTNFTKISEDCCSTLRTPTKLPVDGIRKNPSVTPHSETRRMKAELNQSVSGGRMVNGKWQSLIMDRSKSSTARSPTVSSPFTFRSEERAAKRKEFYKKLEEKKINSKETEKLQSQTKSRERIGSGYKKLHKSMSFKDGAVSDSSHGTGSPKRKITKNSVTQLQSPKLDSRLTSSLAKETSSRPPRRPSIKIESFRIDKEKDEQTPIRALASQSKKNTCENASPNIQL